MFEQRSRWIASIRSQRTSKGTSRECLSYSEQYPQLRLQRRVTISWASMGAP